MGDQTSIKTDDELEVEYLNRKIYELRSLKNGIEADTESVEHKWTKQTLNNVIYDLDCAIGRLLVAIAHYGHKTE